MKIITNSIDSEYFQDSISDADFENQMASCDMETEVLNGHSEEIKISEKNKMKPVEITKLSNGIHEKAGSPTKCNGKVNGFYEEEDFNLVLEDSSEGGSSPSKKIDDDAISAPQIVQEIEDLLGINSSSAVIQEELDNLDGTESIEDNLDTEDVEDTTSEEIQGVFEDIAEDKVEESKEIDNKKKENIEQIKNCSDKDPVTSKCDTSSHMDLVFDEVEVGLESGDLHCPNKSKLTKSDEIDCKLNEVDCKSDGIDCQVGSTTDTKSPAVKDVVNSSEIFDKTNDTTIQESEVNNVEKPIESVEITSAEIPLTQTIESIDSPEEWTVEVAVATSEDEKQSENKKSSKIDEVTENELPDRVFSRSEDEIKKVDCSDSMKDIEINEDFVGKNVSQTTASNSLLPCEGGGFRKRSASTDDEQVELKKPKLKEPSSLVESSSTILKRPLQETTENEIKRTKLDDTIGECKSLDVEDCKVQDKSEEIKDMIKTETLKVNYDTNVVMTSKSDERSLLDSEENVINEKEETKTITSSSSDSPKTPSENDEVKSSIVCQEQSQDKITPEVSTPKGKDQGDDIDSTWSKPSSSLKEVSETTIKEGEPSVNTNSLSKQNSDKIVADNTISSCEQSEAKSEDKIQNCTVLEKKNIVEQNKKNVSSSSVADSKEEEGFKLDDLSSVKNKEPPKLEKNKEISDCFTKAENKITEPQQKLSLNKELSSSIKELEKSVIKIGQEKLQSSVDLKNTESNKMTNLDFAIERVVEKARFQTEKKIPILKKFHKDQLKKLKRSELEDIVLSKICEAVTYKSEIGQMRLRTQNLEETSDMWRKKVQQIEKQNRELEMVLKRFLAELAHIKRENQNKVPMPIKVTRSVGLQVVLASSMHGALVSSRNKMNAEAATQQQQQAVKAKQVEKEKEKAKETVKATTFMPPSQATAARGRGRPAKTLTPQSSRPSTPQSAKITPPATPAKPANLTPLKTIPTPNKDLEVIDLTDKEERAKAASQPSTSGSIRIAPKTQVCFVQQSSASTTPQQPLYLVQKAGQRPQFLVATSSASPQRPMANVSRPPPALALPVFRAGGHLIPVQTSSQVAVKATDNTTSTAVVRQVPSTLRLQSQAAVNKHPAPLPPTPTVVSKPGMKAPPPKPQLKIAKTVNGIMLSWSMTLAKDMAEMQSYQLYAYQEGNQPPSTGLWKKVGDVKALPLPMACTLTQFIEGHKYHFAVRAVDAHGRVGPFSTPSSILLTK